MRTTERADLAPMEDALYGDLASLIEDARGRVATAVNTELVMLYWGIGKRIRDEVLGGERARYREGVVERIAARLAARFGRGYSRRNLFRMLQFAEQYPNRRIVSPLAAQLTWTNICELLTIDEQPRRDFYMAMCAHEHWSKRTLQGPNGALPALAGCQRAASRRGASNRVDPVCT